MRIRKTLDNSLSLAISGIFFLGLGIFGCATSMYSRSPLLQGKWNSSTGTNWKASASYEPNAPLGGTASGIYSSTVYGPVFHLWIQAIQGKAVVDLGATGVVLKNGRKLRLRLAVGVDSGSTFDPSSGVMRKNGNTTTYQSPKTYYTIAKMVDPTGMQDVYAGETVHFAFYVPDLDTNQQTSYTNSGNLRDGEDYRLVFRVNGEDGDFKYIGSGWSER